jgi:hypothetical protein
VAFTTLAAIALVVTALLLVTGQPTVSVVASRAAPPHLSSPPPPSFGPPGTSRQVLQTSASAPVELILLFFAIVALGFAVWRSIAVHRGVRLRGGAGLAVRAGQRASERALWACYDRYDQPAPR